MNKKVLITGKKSYIGTSVKKWLSSDDKIEDVTEICLKDKTWKNQIFSTYDTIFHVAGIAHSDIGKMATDEQKLYYKINKDLAIDVAKKAKNEGVKQFIYMSSMIIYGENTGMITKETPPNPVNFYGDSKLQAEHGLLALADDRFKIVIMRPPMVYGKHSKGNYPRLATFAKKMPIFPQVDNKRSMIHIDNLCEFVRLVIENDVHGVFHPQNSKHVNTSELVVEIARISGKKIRLTRAFNPLLKLLGKRIRFIEKVLGDFSYELALSDYEFDYRVRDFKESIALTEK